MAESNFWSHRYNVILGGILVLFMLSAAMIFLDRVTRPPKATDIVPLDSPGKTSSTAKVNELPELHFAIATMVSPEDTFISYRQLVEEVARKCNRQPRLVLRSSYKQLRQLIESGKVDVALVCTGTYALLAQGTNCPVDLLVVPVFRQDVFYQSVLLCRPNSGIQSLQDLRGKRIALSDPESCTGDFLPRYLFSRENKPLDTYFSSVLYTGSHDHSIRALEVGTVDCTAVDSLVFYAMYPNRKEREKRFRILWQSERYGPPPIVVKKDLDPTLKEQLKTIFLTFNKDRSGQRILSSIGIMGFRNPRNDEYRSILMLYRKWGKALRPRQ
ncbi:MAG: phosphate/phosphite/phosphonate ABC transporter substrate-binding protein [Lentisphaerae bacterium]|nr:MAG: phosphate/phosphite/phosphonate ABC transporter substrate-binding protein [Lentisphaerota bacterium]